MDCATSGQRRLDDTQIVPGESSPTSTSGSRKSGTEVLDVVDLVRSSRRWSSRIWIVVRQRRRNSKRLETNLRGARSFLFLPLYDFTRCSDGDHTRLCASFQTGTLDLIVSTSNELNETTDLPQGQTKLRGSHLLCHKSECRNRRKMGRSMKIKYGIFIAFLVKHNVRTSNSHLLSIKTFKNYLVSSDSGSASALMSSCRRSHNLTFETAAYVALTSTCCRCGA